MKYKITDLAKDLNVKPKDILNLMKSYEHEGSKKKNSQSSLTEDELNFVFDHYTKRSVVEDLDAYLSEKKAPAKAQPTNENTQPAKAVPEQPKEQKKPEITAQEKPQPEKIPTEKTQSENTAKEKLSVIFD